MEKWQVLKECSVERKGMKGRDVVDLLYAFFFTDFEWQIAEDTIELPVFNKNREFITNSDILLKMSLEEEDKKKTYWTKWFSCFAHPLIYLEYEKDILFTRNDERYSVLEDDESKNNAPLKKLKQCHTKHFLTFCKTRTKFIKCYDKNKKKPAFFCQGNFSKLDVKNEELMSLLEDLGYSDIRYEYSIFEENEKADPSTKLVPFKTLDQAIEDAQNNLDALISEKKDKELQDEVEMVPEYDIGELDVVEEVPEDKDDTKKEEDTSFGKRAVALYRAKKAVSNVLGIWNMNRPKKAVRLFKMYGANNSLNRRILNKVMDSSWPLFARR